MLKHEHSHHEASESKKVVTRHHEQSHASAASTVSHHKEHSHMNMEATFGSGGMKSTWSVSGSNGKGEKKHAHESHTVVKHRYTEKNGAEFGNVIPRIAVAHTGTGRLSGGYSGAGTRNLAILTDTEYFGISPDMSNKATKLFLEATGRESTTLHSLNDRLAHYVAHIQKYESENQKIHDNWEAVSKATFSTDSHKYTEYNEQLLSLRKNMDRAFASKAEVEAKKLALELELRNYRARYGELESSHLHRHRHKAMLTELRTEVTQLQARYKQLKDDLDHIGDENRRGWLSLHSKNEEWGKVMKDCLAYKYQSHGRMDELVTFVQDVQEQMVMKLEKKTHIEHQDLAIELKDDLAQAIRDITIEYEMISEQARSETEKWYELKLVEARQLAERKKKDWKFPHAKMEQLKREIETVRSNILIVERDISDLEKSVRFGNEEFTKLKLKHKEELFEHEARMLQMLEERQRMAVALQSILDTMQVHDAEMAIYRTMLEGEERRVGIIKIDKPRLVHQETLAVSTRAYYKTTGENVRIKFCDLRGIYIVLENITSEVQHIGGWQLRRVVDNLPSIDYTIPAGVSLKPNHTIEIYAKGHDIEHKDNALIFAERDTWGTGDHITTTLWNKEGVEMASHIQRPATNDD